MILILGAHGQLGKAFTKALLQQAIDFKAFGRECDISNIDVLYAIFKEYKPLVVINCAAYNLVDDCETNYHLGYKTNTQGPTNLAICANEFGSFLIHYSTDYVYDGAKVGLYSEADKPNPLNEYGKSKLLGEYAICDILENYLILRTSWVYGNGKNNFIAKFVAWSKQNEYIKVAYDEFSVPTSTKTIVQVTLLSIKKDLRGLFCLANSGYCSRFEWASFVNKKLNLKKFIYPVSREIFNLKAKRPLFSAMSNNLLSKTLNIEIQDWQSALEEFLVSDYEEN